MTASRLNPWLDLVRCAAVLLVVLRHGERNLGATSVTPDSLQTVFLNGWVGVDLFFALSGYLIARQLIGAGIGTPSFRPARYLALRALRIVPPYVAVMTLIAVGLFPHYVIDREDLPARIAYHLLFLQDYLPSDINVVFWSLGVEEKFYLAAPLLLLALLRLPGGWTWAFLAGLFLAPMALRAIAWTNLPGDIGYAEFFPAFRSPFHMTLEGLVAGVAIAVAEHRGGVRPSPRLGAALLAGGAAVLLVWLGSHDFMASIDAFDATLQPALVAAAAGAVTLGAVMLGGRTMPLAKPARWLARLSYSLYLVHLPLIPLAAALASGHPLGFWPVYLSTSIAAAVLIQRTVEQPFLDWKDRVAARPGPEAPARQAVA